METDVLKIKQTKSEQQSSTNNGSEKTYIVTEEHRLHVHRLELLHNYSTTREALSSILYNTDLQTPKDTFAGNIAAMRNFIDSLEEQRSNLVV